MIALGLAFVLAVAAVQVLSRSREARAAAEYPPTGQFVEVDGIRVHAHVEGSGPDLVLIHGSNGSTREFTYRLNAHLTDRYRVIALDRPGLGYSEPLPGRATLQAQARHLQKAAAALGAPAPLVLGQSYGGSVALAWTLEMPETLSGLVLVSAPSHTWQGGLPTLYQVTSNWAGKWLAVPLLTAFVPLRYVEGTLDFVFEPQPVPEDYATYFGPELALRRGSFRANAAQRADLKADISVMVPRYREIDVPVEILHGDADTIVPISIHSGPLAKTLPEAGFTVLPGIGHMPHHVAPDMVAAAVDRAAERAGLR